MTTADRAAAAAAGSSGAQSRRAAGASVSPAGRRRHSGAQRSPLPIVPRAPTAFPSVAGQGGSEPPPRPSPPPTAPAAGEAGVASQRSSLEIGVAGREPWSPGRWLHPSSLSPGAGRAAAVGLAVFTSLLPPPASAGWRIPESAPSRGSAAQAGGKLQCVRRGWCIVLYRARRSRLTRFCRGVARGGVTVVLCFSEKSRFRSL